MSDFERTIIHLPGTKLSPQVVLARTLTKIEHIESVVVLIGWKDRSVALDWSEMNAADLAFMAMYFDDQVRAVIRGDKPDNVKDTPA